ncbi:ThiF family adenylyltransferase [Candidatus Woesearchaeota archaeon]|nr:ThiF family adenylyltransferase [Candidatus Woesearchaeota archaeon]
MRYIRQQIFKEIGKKGQEKLGKSTAAIVGIGALGSNSAELLARAGVGSLILIDRDVVELSNLQRQRLFDENDVGKPKALAAKEHLAKINSEIKTDFLIDDLNFGNIGKIFGKKIDLILDCTDNLETRFLINDFCIKYRIPFIYSSAVGSKGYVFDIVPNKTACLRCFLKEAAQLDTCETAGVLNTTTSMISTIQANEAVKILLRKDFEKNLLFFDVWKNELSKIKVNRNNNCVCCIKNNFEYLNGKKASKIVKLCGDNIYQIKTRRIDENQFNKLKNKLNNIGKIKHFYVQNIRTNILGSNGKNYQLSFYLDFGTGLWKLRI